MMFEKQRKIETEGSKATSSAVGDDTSTVQAAPGNEKKAEAPDQNFSGTEVDPSNPSLDRTSRSEWKA